MRVRMIVQMTGTRNGLDWPAVGGTVDLPADEAVQLIAGGLAHAVVEPAPAPETATAPAPETRRSHRRKA